MNERPGLSLENGTIIYPTSQQNAQESFVWAWILTFLCYSSHTERGELCPWTAFWEPP